MNTNYLVVSVLGVLLGMGGMPGSIHLGGPSLYSANYSVIHLADGGTLLNTPYAREPVLGNGLAPICTVSGDGKPVLVNNYTPLVKTPTLVLMEGSSSSMYFSNNLSGVGV